MSKPETITIDEVKYIRADKADVKPTKKQIVDRKSKRLNSSHVAFSRMPSSA